MYFRDIFACLSCCLLSALVICLRRTELCLRAYSLPGHEKNLMNQNQLFKSTVWMSKATHPVCVCMQHCVYGLNWPEVAVSPALQLEEPCRLQD